jgi:hypothetical protein
VIAHEVQRGLTGLIGVRAWRGQWHGGLYRSAGWVRREMVGVC